MRILKQILGVIGVIFGVLGIVLGIVQIVGIWVANPPLTQRLQELTGALQEKLIAAEQAVTKSAELADELSTRLAARPEDVPPVLERLDASIVRVQTTLDLADQTIQTLQSMTGVTGQIPLLGRNQQPTGLSEKLDQATQAVDNVSQKLAELTELSASLTQQGTQSLDQLEARLQTVKGQLNTLATRMDELQLQLAQIEEQLPYWINWGTVALTVLFLWYGIAQLCLLILSWRWVRQPGNGAESTS